MPRPEYLVSGSGIKLACQHYFPNASTAANVAVIFLPGYFGDMSGTKAQYLYQWSVDNGIECLLFDYRGLGKSAGIANQNHNSNDNEITSAATSSVTLGDWLEDATTATNQLVAPYRIIVGSSMGAWIGLIVASQQKVNGLVLLAPAPDFVNELLPQSFTSAQIQELEKDGLTVLYENRDGGTPITISQAFITESEKHRIMPEKGGKLIIDCPVVILHGSEDKDVPLSHAMRLNDCLSSPKTDFVLIKGGDHSLSRPQDLEKLGKALESIQEEHPRRASKKSIQEEHPRVRPSPAQTR